MSASPEIAFRDLVARGLVAISSTLEAAGKLGGLSFNCELPLPHPNSEGLPPTTPASVVIPAQFPHSKVEITLTDPAMRGFAHQEVQTGALCLKEEEHYPHDPSARLLAYIQGAIEWLEHAANGTLLSPGEYWELPDFRTDRTDRPPSLLPLEDESTLPTWLGRVGQFGEVQLTAHVHESGLIPTRFSRKAETVLVPKVSEGFLSRSRSVLGTWVLLPSHIYRRHRPALTFGELREQCLALGIDLWGLLRRAREGKPYRGYHYLLVGAAIPERVDGPLKVVHWQPVAIAESDLRRRLRNEPVRGRRRSPTPTRRDWLQATLLDQRVHWGTSTTYPENRSEARGSLTEPVKAASICVLGCGALGAPIAEHLARGGTRSLALFDKETLDLENLSRHSLSPLETGNSKAVKLAQRLNGIHPSAHVRGVLMQLPPAPRPTRSERPHFELLQQADVLVDCTTSRSVLQWASDLGRQQSKLVVHLFLNAHARMLTLCFSGRHVACTKVERLLYEDIVNNKTSFTLKDYDPDDELVQGAGCWQSTFPARGSDIAALVAAAIPIIERAIDRGRRSQGTAIVLRRRELKPGATLVEALPEALIEVAWAKDYR